MYSNLCRNQQSSCETMRQFFNLLFWHIFWGMHDKMSELMGKIETLAVR